MKNIVLFVVPLFSIALGAAGQVQPRAVGMRNFSLQLGKELSALRFTAMTELGERFNVDIETVQQMIDHQHLNYTAGTSPTPEAIEDKHLQVAFYKANKVDALLGEYLDDETSLAKIAEQLGVDEARADILAYIHSISRQYNEVATAQWAGDLHLTEAKHKYALLLNTAVPFLDTQKLQQFRDAWRQIPANTEATDRLYKRLYDAAVESGDGIDALVADADVSDALVADVNDALADGGDLQAVVEKFARGLTRYAAEAMKLLTDVAAPDIVNEALDQLLERAVLGERSINIPFLSFVGGTYRANQVFARVAHLKDKQVAEWMLNELHSLGSIWKTEALEFAVYARDVDAAQFLIDELDANSSDALTNIVMAGGSEQDIRFLRALGAKVTRENLQYITGSVSVLVGRGGSFYPNIERDFKRLEDLYNLDAHEDAQVTTSNASLLQQTADNVEKTLTRRPTSH